MSIGSTVYQASMGLHLCVLYAVMFCADIHMQAAGNSTGVLLSLVSCIKQGARGRGSKERRAPHAVLP